MTDYSKFAIIVEWKILVDMWLMNVLTDWNTKEKITAKTATIFRRNGLEKKNYLYLYNYLEAIFFNINL